MATTAASIGLDVGGIYARGGGRLGGLMKRSPDDRRPKPSPKPQLAPTTDWHDIAQWYDELVGESGSEYHQHVVLPGVIRLLAPQAGQRVLDVACGQGVLCRLLWTRGVSTVGIDAARDLIELAKKHAGDDGKANRFFVGDARELGFLLEAEFDSAACVLAMQNIHPIQPVFAGVSRALKPGGKFVVAMMHPAFRGAKESHWGWDEQRKVQYRRVDRYLIPRKSPIVAHPGRKQHSEYTWTFHKPIESYVKAARNSGLLIDAIEEWPSHKTSQPGPRQAAENQARKEIPMFMAIRCVKVGASASSHATDSD